MRVFELVASSILAMAAAAAASAQSGPRPPLGPPFGTNRYATTIDPVRNAPDVDDYVADLAQGERLSVSVAADAKSQLHPTLVFVDPAGEEIDPGAASRRGGQTRVAANFVVPATGKWTVRVGATDGAAGGYVVKFQIASAKPSRTARRALGGDAPSAAVHAFQAVNGSALSFSIKSTGAAVAAQSLVDPAGRDVPIAAGATTVPLVGGDGEYRLTVGVEDGVKATYSLALLVKPPPRPKGRAELSGAEPYLAPRAPPIEAVAGTVVRLPGSHFATIPPYPTVSIGDVRTSVVAVGPYGSYLDVGAPNGAVGDVADVTVQNPDGQAAFRSAYVRYASPTVLDVLKIEPPLVVLQEGATQDFAVTLTQPAPPLGISVTVDATGALGPLPTSLPFDGGATIARFRLVASPTPTTGRIAASFLSTVAADVIVSDPAGLASIEPASVHLLEGAVQTFTATLAAPAPPIGLDVAVAAKNGVGTVPAVLHFAGGETSATFQFTATGVRANGKVVVSSADSVEADVAVAPPDSFDLSGWSIVQQNAARTFTVPGGTVLHEGGYLVVGRKATREQFEGFWGRTLGADVVYVNALDKFLVINGSETFELRNGSGTSVDGPSAAMPAAGGADLRRVPGSPAGATTSWTTASASPVSNAMPGAGQFATAAPLGVYLAEFSDANGSGNFVYEFVEVYFDRLP